MQALAHDSLARIAGVFEECLEPHGGSAMPPESPCRRRFAWPECRWHAALVGRNASRQQRLLVGQFPATYKHAIVDFDGNPRRNTRECVVRHGAGSAAHLAWPSPTTPPPLNCSSPERLLRRPQGNVVWGGGNRTLMIARWPEGKLLSTDLPPSAFPDEALRAATPGRHAELDIVQCTGVACWDLQ